MKHQLFVFSQAVKTFSQPKLCSQLRHGSLNSRQLTKLSLNIVQTHLHPDDSVDEEQHDDEQRDVGECLEGLYKSPQQRSDAFAPAQQLYQSHDTEETEEIDRNDARWFGSAAAGVFRRIYFGVNNIDKASEYNDEVENVPRVPEIIFESKCGEFEYKLEREHGSKNHVEYVECLGVEVGLSIELHRECYCVYHDKNENCILERLRCHKPPHFILYAMLGDVSETKTMRDDRNLIVSRVTREFQAAKEKQNHKNCEMSHNYPLEEMHTHKEKWKMN